MSERMTKISLYDYCVQTRQTDIIRQWHPSKNAETELSELSYGSNQTLWWQCEHGHEWEAKVCQRTRGSGCPVCAGKQVLVGFNDLASCDPTLAKEWHPIKNGAVTPRSVTCGSKHRAWWICSRGHEWRASVATRTHGSGCPVCAGRVVAAGENDLASQYPQVAAQWNTAKNNGLTPDKITAHSTKKVWWICEKGHEWQAQISSRVAGSACPYCAGRNVLAGYNDLASQYPELAKQWIDEKNLPLRPDKLSPSSNAHAWWRCEKGHEWSARVASRVSGNGCPYCGNRKLLVGYNDLETVYPKIAKQWNYEKNGSLTPKSVMPGSSKRVWWRCSVGHEWQAIIYSRTNPRKHGCPYCSGRLKEDR